MKLPRLTLRSARLVFANRHVALGLACAEASCKGTVTLYERIVTLTKHGKKTVRKVKLVALSSHRFAIGAGRKVSLSLALNEHGRLLLATASRHRPVHLEVVVVLDGKKRTTDVVVT